MNDTAAERSSAKASSFAAFGALCVAIMKGFVRDRTSVFFALIFPLMFLVLFGGIFNFDQSSQIKMIQVGDVALFDNLPADARHGLDELFDLSRSDDLAAAIANVRDGDAAVAVIESDGDLVAHYSQTDQVKAATVQGALRSFVDGANVAMSGVAPAFSLRTERVEDESLEAIQFITPGLLGWAVAMSASFGAAATLNGWRNSKLLRRLQLAPVSTRTIVGSRLVVTIAVALFQMAVFLGLGTALFGLKLSGAWLASVPLVVIGTLCFMAVGLLAGAVAKTTEGAVNMANFIVLPMSFLSGSFFPLDNAPSWLKFVSNLLPLKHLNEGMTDEMVRGQAWTAILEPSLILAGFAVVVAFAAAKLFRW